MGTENFFPVPPPNILETLRRGTVIPAHPLALTEQKQLDEPHQRALTRYYLAAGAGGLAVGVHTTEFKIHDPAVGLYRPVLELAIATSQDWMSASAAGNRQPVIYYAGDLYPDHQVFETISAGHENRRHHQSPPGDLCRSFIEFPGDQALLLHPVSGYLPWAFRRG